MDVTRSPKLVVPGYLTTEGVEHVRQVPNIADHLPNEVAKMEYWWDFDFDEIRFQLPTNRKVIVRVTQIALNDYFQNPDTRKEAEKSFEGHWQWVQEMAARIHDLDTSLPEILITSEELEKPPKP